MFFLRRDTDTGARIASRFWLFGKTPINSDVYPGHRMTAEESLFRVFDKTRRSPLPSSHGRRHATYYKTMDPHIAPCSDDDNANSYRSGHEFVPICSRCPIWSLATIALIALTMAAWGFLFRSLDSNNIACLSYPLKYCFLFGTPPIFNCKTCVPAQCSFLVMKFIMGYRFV
jgi:hypothetical protein